MYHNLEINCVLCDVKYHYTHTDETNVREIININHAKQVYMYIFVFVIMYVTVCDMAMCRPMYILGEH